MRGRFHTAWVCLLLYALPGRAPGAFTKVDHPFILWDRADIEQLRLRVKSDPLVTAGYDRLQEQWPDKKKGLNGLLRFIVEDDEKAAKTEKDRLMQVVRSKAPRGGAQWVTVLRYDLLHDRLSDAEKAEVEKMFRFYITNTVVKNAVFNPELYNPSANYQRYDAKKYTRTNWLPNIAWPRKVSANLMAVALRDEALIRETWSAYGSFQWYLDHYLSDIGFYHEEFSKMGATPGAMLLLGLGLKRLGLDELGFGYMGRKGATLRGHIQSLIHMAYPQVDLHGDRPHVPIVTMGDLRGSGSSQKYTLPSIAFQHALVKGFLPDGTGGTERWVTHGAWGGETRGNLPQWDGYSGFTPKMQAPFWFELGHRLWPDAGFDYFLSLMRAPGESHYTPSPLFGIEPIDAGKVRPPPAPSAVWPERGFVMLRADETPAYWTSPAPAVSMRLGANYAHNVNDAFCLMGFYAFNRPIYLNRQVTPGYASGWTRGVESHAGVKVGHREPAFTTNVTTQSAFLGPVKFCSAASRDVYPGTLMNRTLFLTREYLLDITHLSAEAKQDVFWFVHTLGEARYDDSKAWKPSGLPERLSPLNEVRKFAAENGAWRVSAVQTCALPDPSRARLPSAWYDRKIGVRIQMLPDFDTDVFTAQTPWPKQTYRDKNKKTETRERRPEVGGVTVIAARNAKRTEFAALHEPFENGGPGIESFHRIGMDDKAIAVAVGGPGEKVNDRLMYSYDPSRVKLVVLQGPDEAFVFTRYLFVRIGEKRVEMFGEPRQFMIQVKGEPELWINGKKRPMDLHRGKMVYPGSA